MNTKAKETLNNHKKLTDKLTELRIEEPTPIYSFGIDITDVFQMTPNCIISISRKNNY